MLQRWKSRRSLQARSDGASDAALRLSDVKTADIVSLDASQTPIPAGAALSESKLSAATQAWLDLLLAWSEEADDAVIV